MDSNGSPAPSKLIDGKGVSFETLTILPNLTFEKQISVAAPR